MRNLTRRAATQVLAGGVAAALLTAMSGCGGQEATESTDPDQHTWDSIASGGVLRIGTEGTYPPYSYHGDDGNLTGYDIELAQMVAKDLGLKAEFQEMGFDGLAAGLDAEQFDMVADEICITFEREKKYLFSSPYAYVRGVIITRSDYDGVSSFGDLSGKQVALTVTSNWAQMAEEHGATIVSTGGFAESMQMVMDGRADATVNDNLVFLDYRKSHPDDAVTVAAMADEVNRVAFMFRGNQGVTQAKVSEALDRLRGQGAITELSQRYFGEDISVEQA